MNNRKYNIVNFLPLALFYQMKNVGNIYFLISAILASIPIISPIDPLSAIMPLVFVIGFSMLKELADDFKIYAQDKKTNN